MPSPLLWRTLINIVAAPSTVNEDVSSGVEVNRWNWTTVSKLASPLTHIYNIYTCVYIQSRIFPEAWKHGNVIPHPRPKSSEPSIDKLRPISLLPIPSKVFEELILHSKFHSRFLQSISDSRGQNLPKLVHLLNSLIFSPVRWINPRSHEYNSLPMTIPKPLMS